MPRTNTRLCDLGENEIVRRLTKGLPLSPQTLIGAGDDCAVLSTMDRNTRQLFKTDCIVEHIHFLPSAPPSSIGWKALCRCISDVAAMGGRPTEALVTIAAPKTMAWQRLAGIYQGLRKACKRYGIGLVGGETSTVPDGAPLFISVSLLGAVDKSLLTTRSGGRAGDLVYVTGVLGGSIKGWHLKFEPRLEAAQWLMKNFRPTAMMDLSDGLGQDLPRLANASETGFELFPTLFPLRKGCSIEQAFSDGEDYELLFTLPVSKAVRLEPAWAKAFPKLRLTHIGNLTSTHSASPAGWDHFR